MRYAIVGGSLIIRFLSLYNEDLVVIAVIEEGRK
jgi:hypothetical protein